MVRSTFFGFTTALRGMGASQKALDVTGNNIGNVNTRGYTRQRADLYSAVSGGYGSRYASIFANEVGNGVVVGGISQIRDPFLDVRFRSEANKLGEIDARITSLKDLATIFDETMTDGMKAQVADVIKQLNSLASNTGNAEFDGIVKASMDVMTKLFNQYSNEVGKIKDQQDNLMKDGTVPDINNILKNIAELNKSIKSDQLHGNPALELIDQRNILLDELSSYMNISITSSNTTEISKGIVLSDLKIQFLDEKNNPLFTLLEGGDTAQLTYKKDSTGKTVIGVSPATGSSSLNETVDDLNLLAKDISDLNNQIRSLTVGTPPTEEQQKQLTELEGKRSAYLDQMKLAMPGATITTSTPGADGKSFVSISAHGGNIVTDNGTTSAASTFSLTGNKIIVDGVDVTSNIGHMIITDKFSSGIMKGALDMLNKSGEFDTPPSTNRGIGYYEKMLDTIASKLANEFNDMNSWNKTNADKNPVFDASQPESATNLRYTANADFIAAHPNFQPGVVHATDNPDGALYPPGNAWKPLFADRDGKDPITAKGLSIAQGWVDSDYNLTTTKKPIISGDNSGQRENVIEMIALFDKKIQFAVGDNPATGAKLFLGSFNEVFGQVGNVLDLDLNSSNKIFKNHITVLNGVDDLRSGLSSVSLDEEAVNLLKYQKSYNAAARLMTTLDEAISTIIHNMGRVGV